MRIAIAILALFFSASAWSQEVVMAARHRASAVTSNIQFQGQFTANTSTTQTSLSQAYTCTSTSNRLVIIAEGQSGLVSNMTLTDTGGQAAGATVLFAAAQVSGVMLAAWNSGCAAGSNTYTTSETGVGGGVGIVLSFAEYSGLSSSAGSNTSGNVASGQVFSFSGTAAQGGMLALAYLSISNQQSFFKSTTSPFNYRNVNIASGGNGAVNTSYPIFDNISVSAGAVSFSTTTGASTPSGGQYLLLLVPGTAASSPGWNPGYVQSNSFCNTSTGNAVAYRSNVTSGDLLIYAYKSENTASPPTTVTDTLSTPYTLRVNKAVGSSNAVWIYTGIAPSSGADTVTANGSSLNFPCSQVTEIAGPVGTFTDSGGQTTSSGTMTWSQTVSTANSIVYAVCGGFSSSDTFQMTGVGFSATSQGNGGDGIGGSYARTVSTSAVTPIITISTSNSNVCASIVVH